LPRKATTLFFGDYIIYSVYSPFFEVMNTENSTQEGSLKQTLNLSNATMIIMGSMIGSGIFIVPAAIARDVSSPGLIMLIWLITAVITIAGALSYGELSAMYPKAGGQYVYLKEIYHPMVGFMYGWALFAVIQTGTIAAVGMAFAKFLGVMVPSISQTNVLLDVGFIHLNTQQLIAILLIVFLTVFNFRSVKDSAFLQTLFTTIKIASLLGMIALAFILGNQHGATWQHFKPLLPSTDYLTVSNISIFITAMVGALFSADAWNNITFTAGEVINPQKNIPLSLILGTGSVLLIYLLANIAYMYVMPLEMIQNAPQDRVSTQLLNQLVGNSGMLIMAWMIMISTYGCLNGVIMSGARVYYAMAKDRLFFPQAKKLNKNGVPQYALILQAIWASLLVMSGSYGDLLDYVIFAVLLFYILTIGGLMVARKKFPTMDRPYKTILYPFTPILYIILATTVCLTLLFTKPAFTLTGLGIVLLAIPMYYFINQKNTSLE
jgi:APA family basic amino acid/polyamine antiporter